MIERDDFGFRSDSGGFVSKEHYEAYLRGESLSHSGQAATSVRCTRCGRFTDSPTYHKDLPYGSECIRWARNSERPTREYVTAPPYAEVPRKKTNSSWIEIGVDVVVTIGALALLLLTGDTSKKKK
jgi:hypothetical protein